MRFIICRQQGTDLNVPVMKIFNSNVTAAPRGPIAPRIPVRARLVANVHCDGTIRLTGESDIHVIGEIHSQIDRLGGPDARIIVDFPEMGVAPIG